MEALTSAAGINTLINKKKISYNPFLSGNLTIAVPATNAQKEMWSSIKMDDKASLCYNECVCVEFNGVIDLDLLNRSFREIVRRHDALRMVFSKDGKMLSVLDDIPAALELIDLSQEKMAEEILSKIYKTEVTTLFDLENGPVYRSRAIKIQKDKFLFLLTVHHIVCDGWSFGVLLKDLAHFYNMLVKGAAFVSQKAPQFSDFAASESLIKSDHHRQYWLNEFKSVSDKNFPVDFERASVRSFTSKRIDMVIPEATVRSVKKLSAAEKCSFYNTLIAAFNVFLYRLTGSSEVITGLASAQQATLEEQELVGHLVNLLPLKINLDNKNTFRDLLKIVKNKMLDAFEHQEFAYGAIVKDLKNLKRKPGEIPLLNVVFNIDQQLTPAEMTFNNIVATYKTIPREYENFEIFINAVSSGDSLTLECQYNSELFSLPTITNWLHSFAELLSALVPAINLPLEEIQIPRLKVPKTETKSPSLTILKKNCPEEETIVINCWKKILLLENILPTDNFFSLGGHSLLGIEVAQSLQTECKVNIGLKDIFQFPTVQDLAFRLNELKNEINSANKKNETTLVSTGKTEYPVSHNQLSVWYLEEVFPHSTLHNLPAALRIRSSIDLEILTKALRTIIARHPSLRTSIEVKNGRPVQKIQEDLEQQFKVKFQKIRESSLEAVLKEESHFIFDKQNAPLFKASLYELGPQDNVLFFLAHHAVWDGWSFDIFFEELNVAYTALADGDEPLFTATPQLSYIDHTHWLEERIKRGELQHELNFWMNQLKAPLPILELPLDYKRPLKPTHTGKALPFTLSDSQMYLVREYAKINGVSLFNVFLTAFKTTLALYHESQEHKKDIIVGMPVRGRVHPDIMNTIGYFVNTVALRSTINLQESFEYNLQLVSDQCQQALDHQLIPFQVVLNKLNLPRDNDRTPVFQSFFSFQDVSNRSNLFNGEKYTQVIVDRSATHTEIDLWIKAATNKIEGAFEYRSDLFSHITVERFQEVFVHILDNLMSNIQKPLLKCELLPEKQRSLITNDWNKTEILHPFKSIAQLFKEQVKENPLKVAVETDEESLTYKDLDRLSDNCAHHLILKGVNKGDIVGICLHRRSGLLAALLGVIKAGAAYLPLDPYFPKDRLDYMVTDAQPRIIISQRDLAERFSFNMSVILQEDIMNEITPAAELAFPVCQPNDLLYAIYTSGSTGKPKGVEISHGNLHNFLISLTRLNLFSRNDKLLAVTTLSFDIAALELFLPLITGGSLYLAQSFQVVDGAVLSEILTTKKITVLQATPSTWRLLFSSGWQGNKNLRALCGGEAFPQDLAQKLLHCCKAVWNMYGPTETTVWSTCKKLSLDDQFISIGRPLDNTFVYILDESKKLRPVGCTGEIYIGGNGLALGYKGKRELTDEKFVNDPFRPGYKIYSTGDLGKFTSNGELICLGRNDSQVKVRGYRIELGEIEAQLLSQPEIDEVCVVNREVRPEDVRIIAYIKLKHGKIIDEKQLREKISHMLPSYMLPSHYIYIEEIPKTLNGKIDRKGLPVFKINHDSQSVTSPEPKTQDNQAFPHNAGYENKFYEIFRDVLALETINGNDNFFNLGGNSLLAVSAMEKLTTTFSINLPLSLLVESNNFSELFLKIKSYLKTNTTLDEVPKMFKSLVSLRNTGVKNPLYFFHGVGGNVLNYVGLIPAAKNLRPLMALQSYGLDGSCEPFKSIESMAEAYIREIKMIQPEGPYLLAGGSMGGIVAFEAARQLKSRGEVVEKLIMFDTFGPNLNLKNYQEHRTLGLAAQFKNAFFYRTELFVNSIQESFLKLLGRKLPLQLLLKKIERNNYKAIWKYRPKAYPGDLHLIRSNSVQGWYSDPEMGWKGIIKGKLSIQRIPGSHENFIESPQLVDALSRIIC